MFDSDRILRRYTNLPALLHLLRTRKLTLLSPEKWEDRNDAYYMSQYRERSDATTVLALCFSEAAEKYHLWRAFTHGTDGVCVEFERNSLLASFDGVEGIEKTRRDLQGYQRHLRAKAEAARPAVPQARTL